MRVACCNLILPNYLIHAINKFSYINDVNRQLNVTSNYKKFRNDPAVIHSALINDPNNPFKQEQLTPKKLLKH